MGWIGINRFVRFLTSFGMTIIGSEKEVEGSGALRPIPPSSPVNANLVTSMELAACPDPSGTERSVLFNTLQIAVSNIGGRNLLVFNHY